MSDVHDAQEKYDGMLGIQKSEDTDIVSQFYNWMSLKNVSLKHNQIACSSLVQSILKSIENDALEHERCHGQNILDRGGGFDKHSFDRGCK